MKPRENEKKKEETSYGGHAVRLARLQIRAFPATHPRISPSTPHNTDTGTHAFTAPFHARSCAREILYLACSASCPASVTYIQQGASGRTACAARGDERVERAAGLERAGRDARRRGDHARLGAVVRRLLRARASAAASRIRGTGRTLMFEHALVVRQTGRGRCAGRTDLLMLGFQKRTCARVAAYVFCSAAGRCQSRSGI